MFKNLFGKDNQALDSIAEYFRFGHEECGIIFWSFIIVLILGVLYLIIE